MNEANIEQQCADTMFTNDRASQTLGIVVEIPAAGTAIARLTVREDMLNGFDVIHGGLTFALADTAFAFACNSHNNQSFAASAQIEFLRPARLGDVLTATAEEDYRGRKSGYYSINVHNQDNQLIAIFRGRSASNGLPLVEASSDT